MSLEENDHRAGLVWDHGGSNSNDAGCQETPTADRCGYCSLKVTAEAGTELRGYGGSKRDFNGPEVALCHFQYSKVTGADLCEHWALWLCEHVLAHFMLPFARARNLPWCGYHSIFVVRR